MENGNSAGTWLAYALIVLFLIILGLAIARTMVLTPLLLISPIRHAWTWLRTSFRRKRGL